jgi:hypothetical protein
VVGGGQHGDGMRPTMRFNGGGWSIAVGALEGAREGQEVQQRGVMVRGSSGSFYRGRGGHWRGGRREDGVPSMAARTGAEWGAGEGKR